MEKMKLSRPPSDQLVDLHISVVPLEHWIERLNYASEKIIGETFSVGFVRAHPESSIRVLRNDIYDQLGSDVFPVKYVFLKHIGRCLALVRETQEMNLKVKNFVPPQTMIPEIFVLPTQPRMYSQYAPNMMEPAAINHSANPSSTHETDSVHLSPSGDGAVQPHMPVPAKEKIRVRKPKEDNRPVQNASPRRNQIPRQRHVSGKSAYKHNHPSSSLNTRSPSADHNKPDNPELSVHHVSPTKKREQHGEIPMTPIISEEGRTNFPNLSGNRVPAEEIKTVIYEQPAARKVQYNSHKLKGSVSSTPEYQVDLTPMDYGNLSPQQFKQQQYQQQYMTSTQSNPKKNSFSVNPDYQNESKHHQSKKFVPSANSNNKRTEEQRESSSEQLQRFSNHSHPKQNPVNFDRQSRHSDESSNYPSHCSSTPLSTFQQPEHRITESRSHTARNRQSSSNELQTFSRTSEKTPTYNINMKSNNDSGFTEQPEDFHDSRQDSNERFEDQMSEPGSEDDKHDEDHARFNSVWIDSMSNNYYDERDDNAVQFLNERNMYGDGERSNNGDTDITEKSLQSEYRNHEDISISNSSFERQQRNFQSSGNHFIPEHIDDDDEFQSRKNAVAPEKQYDQFDLPENSIPFERQNGQLSENNMTPGMEHEQLAGNPTTTEYYGGSSVNRGESEGHMIYRNKYADESSDRNETPGVFITSSQHDHGEYGHKEAKTNSFAKPTPTSSPSAKRKPSISVQRNPSSVLNHFVSKSPHNFNVSPSNSVEDFQKPQQQSHSQNKQLPPEQLPWTESELNSSSQAILPKDGKKRLSSIHPGGNKTLELVEYNSVIEHVSQESRGHPDGKPVIHLLNRGSREKPYRNTNLPPLQITENDDHHRNIFPKSSESFVEQDKNDYVEEQSIHIPAFSKPSVVTGIQSNEVDERYVDSKKSLCTPNKKRLWQELQQVRRGRESSERYRHDLVKKAKQATSNMAQKQNTAYRDISKKFSAPGAVKGKNIATERCPMPNCYYMFVTQADKKRHLSLIHSTKLEDTKEKDSKTWQRNVLLKASKERLLNAQSNFQSVSLPKITQSNQKRRGNLKLKSDYSRNAKTSETYRFKNVRFSETNVRNIEIRNAWKKRYFNEKKNTPPLDELRKKLFDELNSSQKAMLSSMELKKEDNMVNSFTSTKPSVKANNKILATRLHQSMEDLKRKVGDTKVKLTGEIRLRHQEEQDLKILRQKLMKKKIQSHTAYRMVARAKTYSRISYGKVTA